LQERLSAVPEPVASLLSSATQATTKVVAIEVARRPHRQAPHGGDGAVEVGEITVSRATSTKKRSGQEDVRVGIRSCAWAEDVIRGGEDYHQRLSGFSR
jgi:hypothetical protein